MARGQGRSWLDQSNDKAWLFLLSLEALCFSHLFYFKTKISTPIELVSPGEVMLIDVSWWSLRCLRVERMEKKNMGMENVQTGPQYSNLSSKRNFPQRPF